MRRKIAHLFLCTALSLAGVSAQVSVTTQQRPEELFRLGEEAFQSGNYLKCTDLLITYESIVPAKDSRRESVAYLLARCAYERNLPDALSRMEQFIQQYPYSVERDPVRFNIANWYFFHQEYDKAITAYLDFDMERLAASDQENYCYRLGLSYLKENRTAEAKPFFLVLTTLGDQYRDAAFFYTAYIDYTEGKYKQAQAQFRKVAHAESFAIPASYYLTQIDFLNENYQKVISSVSQLLEQPYKEEYTTELYRIGAESSYALGEEKQAYAWLSEYLERASHPVASASYIWGVLNYKRGNYPEAIQYLSRTTAGGDVAAQSSYLYLGLSYLKSGDKKSAQLSFEMASQSEADPKVQESALYNYALSMHENTFSPFSESVVVFEKLLNKYPQTQYADVVNDYLVEVYLNAKNYRIALESINKIKHPDAKILAAKQRILFQLGTESFANSDFAAAKKQFTDAILVGNYAPLIKAQSYFWRGECAYRCDEFSQAVTDYRTYLSTTPEKSGKLYLLAQYDLAYAYYKLNQFSESNRWFQRYIDNADGSSDKRMIADAYARIGDGYFYGRNFAQAQSYYAKAADESESAADYALFQRGFVAGLQKDYRGKISVLDQLIAVYPQSEYMDDALFEKGRTYVQLEESSQAATAFRKLLQQYPQSPVSRKAGIQLGLLYFNENKLDDAVAAYKQVISVYPGSDEAKVAAQDLKSVYLEKNDVAGYAEYINSLGGLVRFAAGEQDSLTFLAAEKLYMRNQYPEAEKSLIRYLQSFEAPAFAVDAHYYLAGIYLSREEPHQALSQFEAVLQQPNSKYEEEALRQSAAIYHAQKAYEPALARYTTLEARATSAENRLEARLGILRMNKALQRFDAVIATANQLLSDAKLSPEWAAEARFERASAYQEQGHKEAAAADWAVLARDPRTVYGAESAYLEAQYLFDKGDDAVAEQQVTQFIEAGTPHAYWMARSFILLSDIYEKRGDLFQAKQYLQSLQNNYTAADDIASRIAERLKRMGE